MNNQSLIEKTIKTYNEHLLLTDFNDMSIGLFEGKMGLCIYLYMQYRQYRDKRFKKAADRLLQEIYSKINDCKEYDLASGLTGIAFGLLFLMESKLCEGDPNTVLQEIDATMYKNLYNSCNNANSAIYDDISKCMYFCKRLDDKRLPKKEREIYTMLIITAFNKLYKNMSYIISSEPIVFSPFGYPLLLFLQLTRFIAEFHIYDYKIQRTLKEWEQKLHAVYPTNIGHRLLLDYTLTQSEDILCHDAWKRHHLILTADTDIAEFFLSEMKNMSLSISSGASALWLYMQLFGIHSSTIKDHLSKKISCSEIWTIYGRKKNVLTGNELSEGMPGVILTYQHLCHHEKI